MITVKDLWRIRWLVLISLGLLLCRPTAGEERAIREYQVKAAFLYNFTKFVTWPDQAFASNSAPLVIGIVGDNPFDTDLEDVVRGESIHGHRLVVKKFRVDEDLTGCQLLFVSRSARDKLGAILKQAEGRPILTISDTPGFAEQGVMANLLLVKDNIKMEINRKASEAAGLRISAKLLGLAAIVETRPDSGSP